MSETDTTPAAGGSWKAEVIADSTGRWCGNALRFPTKTEAEAYVRDLAGRWLAVRDTRVVTSDDAPCHCYVDGKTEPLAAP